MVSTAIARLRSPQDVVERFHLFCALAFVLVEDMNNSGTWRPSRGLAWQCAYFLGAEVVIGVFCTRSPHLDPRFTRPRP